jgi:hypothetical protein
MPVAAFVISILFVLISIVVTGTYSVKEKREGEVLEEEPGYEWRRNEDEAEE